MSQSLLHHAFGVRRGYEYWRTAYGEGCVRFFLLVKPELLVCPACGSREVSRKGRRFRELQTGEEGITVWVRPEQVVEIALDGVQASPRYPGGVALRFARVVRYRDDKDAAEADTIDTVRALLLDPS